MDETNRCHQCGEPIPDRVAVALCQACREQELAAIAALLAPVGWEDGS